MQPEVLKSSVNFMVREKKKRLQDSDWECGKLILGRPATAEQERKHLEKAVLPA